MGMIAYTCVIGSLRGSEELNVCRAVLLILYCVLKSPGDLVTDSIKTLKMAHIKKKNLLKKCILIQYIYVSYKLPVSAEAAGPWTTL